MGVRSELKMIYRVLVWLTLFFCAFPVMADDIVRLQCDAMFKKQASYPSEESGKTTLAVDVFLNGQAVRRIIVFGEGKRLAIVDAVKSTQIKNHAAVDTSDPRRWNLYNTWSTAHGDPESALINIDRHSGDITLSTKSHSGGDWQMQEYSGNCNKVGGNNTRF